MPRREPEKRRKEKEKKDNVEDDKKTEDRIRKHGNEYMQIGDWGLRENQYEEAGAKLGDDAGTEMGIQNAQERRKKVAGDGYMNVDEAFDDGSSNSSTVAHRERNQCDLIHHPTNDPVTKDVVSESVMGQAVAPSVESNYTKRCLGMTAGILGFLAIAGGGTTAALYFMGILDAAKRNKTKGEDPTIPENEIPATPEDLTATAEGNDRINLGWQSVANATGYVVRRGDTEVANLPAGSTGFLVTGLEASTEYCHTVSATNKKGSSKPSDEVCATTGATPPPIPEVPKGLRVVANDFTSFLIQWEPVPGANSYVLRRRLASDLSEGAPIATVEASAAPSYSDSGLEEATQYCYTVSAANAAGASEDSGFVCGNTLNACDELSAKIVDEWNQLPEKDFWNQMKAWVIPDPDDPENLGPSLDCQLNVVLYAYNIADQPTPVFFDSEVKLNSQADSIVAQFGSDLSDQDLLNIYTFVSTLGGDKEVTRYEKLNVLARVLARLLKQ